ncbi:hypothetical protein VSH64_42280 [Amycolatopsis rhabdoformis]|uniref:Uncharacterized protein n=1 Tax=Amycolatopsis rhabdoformis TaxID=1448059 RepID=A0ABZ1I6M1_9PSEU|nr:hypothetical protein [Amycolatopsis rhabdoformis]WSE29366.1 hypothetical protein VSH64_42280 [Amycolatopsis rhabdoformis]
MAIGLGDDDRPASPQPARAAHDVTPPAVTAADSGIGVAAILRPAGPLHAHIENLEQLICDPYTATAAGAGGGYTVHVTFPGPANLTVYALTVDEQSTEQHRTLGAQEAGATFAFTGRLDQVLAISVSETSDRGPGTCDVLDRTP